MTVAETSGTGLSEVEAARRLQARGELPRRRSSRSYASIVRANTVTIPNGILLLFGVLTITFGSWRDALFLGILVSNIAIGSFQEIRSKRALDRLAALVAPEAVVVRDGVDRRVPVDQVVVGDLVRLAAGDQVVADGTIVSADGLALDEANLTGESEPAVRGPGEPVWSGSFAVEGTALFEATAVGPDSRAERLTATARAFRHPRSPLERANDRLLLWLIALSVPLAIGLTGRSSLALSPPAARVQVVTAGIVNLVPEGLILLISVTAAVSAFKMAQRGVLAQQLNAIESLASVDVVCTDKTGTLTEPTLRVVDAVPLGREDETSFARELASYAASAPSRNLTLEAIADAGLADVEARRVVAQVPFSSRRRWSALDLGDERLVLGAPERFADADPALAERAREEASAGRRVLALGRSPIAAARRRPRAAVSRRRAAARPGRARRAPSRQRGRDGRLLHRPGRRAEGALRRRARHRRRDRPRRRRARARRRRSTARRSRPSRRALREAVLAAPAVGRISPEGKRAVVAALAGRRSLRRDGRRRRQRRARAQGGAPGDRPGLRDADGALGRRPRARPRRLRRRARDGRRGAPDPAQHPAGRPAVHHQDRVHGRGRPGGRDPDRHLPAAPAPVHDRLHGHDRHPRLPARARAELRAVAAGALPASRSPASRSRPGSRSGSGSSPATCSRATDSTSA